MVMHVELLHKSPPGDGEGEGKEKPSRFGEHFEAEMRSFLTDAKLRVSKLQQQSDEAPSPCRPLGSSQWL